MAFLPALPGFLHAPIHSGLSDRLCQHYIPPLFASRRKSEPLILCGGWQGLCWVNHIHQIQPRYHSLDQWVLLPAGHSLYKALPVSADTRLQLSRQSLHATRLWVGENMRAIYLLYLIWNLHFFGCHFFRGSMCFGFIALRSPFTTGIDQHDMLV